MLLIPNGNPKILPTVLQSGDFFDFIDQPFIIPSIGNLTTMDSQSGTIIEQRVYAFMLSFWGDRADNMFTYFSLHSSKTLRESIPLVTVVSNLTRIIMHSFGSQALITPRRLNDSPTVALLRATLQGQTGFYLYDGERVIDAYAELKEQLCTK
jgi:hypothetical protein